MSGSSKGSFLTFQGRGAVPTRAGPSECEQKNGNFQPIRVPMVVPNLVLKFFVHHEWRVPRCCDNGYIGMGRQNIDAEVVTIGPGEGWGLSVIILSLIALRLFP